MRFIHIYVLQSFIVILFLEFKLNQRKVSRENFSHLVIRDHRKQVLCKLEEEPVVK